MPNTLIFIRHGITGLAPVESTPCCLPFFNYEDQLALYGHIYSFKLGEFIKENYGIPKFIYANIADRTVATGVAIAQGSGQRQIWLAQGEDDSFFTTRYNRTTEGLEISEDELLSQEPQIREIRQNIEKCLPCISLETTSGINENGEVTGLISQLEDISDVGTFAQLSKTSLLSKCEHQLFERAFIIKQRIEYPDYIVPMFGDTLLSGIMYILREQSLSVLAAHSTNVTLIGRALGNIFKAPGYALGYVPPNSGFIFTLDDKHLTIQILYLGLCGKFHIIPYLKRCLLPAKNTIPPLVTKRV